MFGIYPQDEISYREQADRLFNLPAFQENRAEVQQIIPFLGAGVSISARPVRPRPTPKADLPDAAKIEECCRSLGLEGDSAKLFMRMAAFLALCLDAEKDFPSLEYDKPDSLRRDASPPSARQLARMFSNLSTYTAFKQVVDDLSNLYPEGYITATEPEQIDMFKRLARITRIADPPDPLTSITSYYENKEGRGSLWTNLRSVMSRDREPTFTHNLLAAAAKRHLAQPDVWDDYLILTTNYDCLMEIALDRARVDYVVLTTRKSDQKVLVRFSDTVKDAKMFTEKNSGKVFPENLHLTARPKGYPLVIVCKMHGCLNPRLTEKDDGLVISDNDYVNYISHMNSVRGTIPSVAKTIMQDKPFLFLGYSFNDWNVRSVFELTRKKRGEDFEGQDYSAMSYVGEFQRLFFQRNGVAILKTDLNTYADSVVKFLKELKRDDPEKWGALVDQILSWILGPQPAPQPAPLVDATP